MKTIDLRHLNMANAQAEMILIKNNHKKEGNKGRLNFLLPIDKRTYLPKPFESHLNWGYNCFNGLNRRGMSKGESE